MSPVGAAFAAAPAFASYGHVSCRAVVVGRHDDCRFDFPRTTPGSDADECVHNVAAAAAVAAASTDGVLLDRASSLACSST